MQIEPMKLPGLMRIQPRVFEDSRGFFFESYRAESFERAGLCTTWPQDNHARSSKNTVRGLHFAPGVEQCKLIRCLRGAIWDVVVDIRPDSPTLGQWEAIELTETNRTMLYIPAGFAHGYAALTEPAECHYKTSVMYRPGLESEILWNDPEIGIPWPVDHPIVSDRDRQAASFNDYLESLRRG
jgi:dTDP-4-dehydrorhamnose 3,5-epimerase